MKLNTTNSDKCCLEKLGYIQVLPKNYIKRNLTKFYAYVYCYIICGHNLKMA